MMTADDLAHLWIFLVATVVALLGAAGAWAVVDWRCSSRGSRQHEEEAIVPGAIASE